MKEYKGSPALDAGSSPPLKRSSITRFRAMARCGPGPKNSVWRMRSHCLRRRSKKKATDEALTEIALAVVNQEAEAAESAENSA